MLRGTLHLIEDDLQNYPGEGMWFAWLDWDVFDHWRFVWEPNSEPSRQLYVPNG